MLSGTNACAKNLSKSADLTVWKSKKAQEATHKTTIRRSNATTFTRTTTLLTPSAGQTLNFSGSFTNSGGNRSLTGGNGAGTAAGVITLSGNVYLSEAAATGRTL